MRTPIHVYADWKQIGGPRKMGILYSEIARGDEIFSFEYDKDWLQSPHSTTLDPDLRLYEHAQYIPANEGKELFGLFTDSAPDKWGKLLMRRREAAYARIEDRPEKRFLSSDYMLGVYDTQRMGGLRYKLSEDGEFLNSDQRLAAPPMAHLRELEGISRRLESDDAVDDPEYLDWLNQLIAPGSSLGGARPKAGVVDANGDLWIAKFPSQSDLYDVGAWEMVAHEMAREIGIAVPEARIEKFASDQNTFLIKRFDRQGDERIHFTSAMTMLGQVDFTDDASYIDVAEWIIVNSASPNEDLEELFKRMVFNVCISNVDDHLRNHGFVLTEDGWRLSPAYDMNPIADGGGLRLNISENFNALDLDLCLEVSEQFRLSKDQTIKIIGKCKQVTGTFETVAKRNGIGKGDILLVSQAFKNYLG